VLSSMHTDLLLTYLWCTHRACFMVGGLCSEELLGSVPLIDMLLMSGHDWSQTVDIERHAI
jgi:hypothetical protein